MTIRQRITEGTAAIWSLGKGLILTCAAALCVAVIGYTGYQLWNNGYLDQIIPEPEVVKVSPPEPLAVVMHGPAKGVTGVTYVFTAEVTGNAGKAVWDVTPLTEGATAEGTLRTFDLGRWAEFTAVDEGDFLISVTIGGEANQSAAAKIKFQNLMLANLDDLLPPEPEPPPESHVTPAPMPGHAPEPLLSVEEELEFLIGQVNSADKGKERRMLAGSVRLLAQRANTGLLPPDADIPVELERQAKAVLGEKFGPWQSFVTGIDDIFNDLRGRGQVTTAGSTSPLLIKIADVLQNAH